ALKKMDVIPAKVIRDGQVIKISAEQLVPGDLLPLEAGDIVPCDGRLTEVHGLQCDESSLTGESLPADKDLKETVADTQIGDQLNMVFKGTAVTRGNGKAIVTGIAGNTELGTITSLVENSGENITPLDKKLNKLSRKLIWITLAMTAIFAITGIVQGKTAILIIETSIALAVAAIPEGLPIVATVALSYGMLLMAKRNAIVKKLSSVETLGSTGVILTDKTGTLTENKIYTDTLCFPDESVKVTIKNNALQFPDGQLKTDTENFNKLIMIGLLCNNAVMETDAQESESTSLAGDPVEVALIQLARAGGLDIGTIKQDYKRIGEVPFNSDIMMMGTQHKTAAGYFIAAKGSVEHVLEKCDKVLREGGIASLDDDSKKAILAKSEKMAVAGLRVLAFGYSTEAKPDENDFLKKLTYAGMAGFLDPPRTDIKAAILTCRNAGIKVVMITGDHPQTALNIARKVGLIDEGDTSVITGRSLPKAGALSDEWIKKILSTAVFARASPKQKLEIAKVYQHAGYIVAMTGDGVNDAPALKVADVGIAMGMRGTQVAKETASIILKDDSFTSISEAVAHGREIFQNIQKFVVYLISCNLSEIFIVTLLGIIAPASTLLPLQILFLNMVTDIFPALALGLGTGDKTVMHQPPRDPKKDIVTPKDWWTISVHAVMMTLAVVAAEVYCRQFLGVDARAANNVAFITLTFAQLFHVFNMPSKGSGFFINEVTTNKFVWLAIILCAGLTIGVFITPGLRAVLNLSVLPLKLWGIAILASALPLVFLQGWKLIAQKFITKSKTH
ncbi:MAG: cation-transporting P-type ATPase, partial [Mucilaginibacter sp.]